MIHAACLTEASLQEKHMKLLCQRKSSGINPTRYLPQTLGETLQCLINLFDQKPVFPTEDNPQACWHNHSTNSYNLLVNGELKF